jgi:hypothetical protein
MMRILLILLFTISGLGCGKKPYFPESADFFQKNQTEARPGSGSAPFPAPRRHQQGFYTFNICTKETEYQGELIDWFCYCADEGASEPLETIALMFIDDVRVLFFRNPYQYFDMKEEEKRGWLHLDDIHDKVTRLGIYHWNSATGTLNMRLRPLKASDPDAALSDVDLQMNSEGKLVLKNMSYPDNDRYLVQTARRSKTNPARKPGMKSIAPDQVFHLPKIEFCFLDKPMRLQIQQQAIREIRYETDGSGKITRRYIGPDQKLILSEMLSDSASVKSW